MLFPSLVPKAWQVSVPDIKESATPDGGISERALKSQRSERRRKLEEHAASDPPLVLA
jgi:hypothetical protein